MEAIARWQWQIGQPNGRWRLLACRMTGDRALAWAEREGKELQKVLDSKKGYELGRWAGGFMDALGTPYEEALWSACAPAWASFSLRMGSYAGGPYG